MTEMIIKEENRFSLSKEQLAAFCRKHYIKKLSLFGSILRDDFRSESDIDILVEFYMAPSLLKFIDMENYLSEILGIKVDLVMKSSLKHYIGKRILKEVIYLWERTL